MKKTLLFFVIGIFVIASTSLSSQTWQWATIEAGAYAEGYALAKDNAGNIFLAGNNTGPATFGASSFTAPNSGNYVLKYSPAGTLLWAFTFNPTSSAIIDIDTDNAGNVYLSCGLYGTFVVGNYTLVSSGNTDMLLMKISNAGTLLWAKSFGGLGTEYTSSIAADGSGNFVVCGTYNSSSINFSTLTLTNPNLTTGFVVKFDANGNALWANNLLSPNNPLVTSVSVDVNSNAYVTGSFNNQISAGTTTLNSSGASDVFVAKYSNTGALNWMVRTGANGQEYANGIKPDPFGNVYFTGRMAGNLCAIGSSTYATVGGSWDTYIAKLDSTGIFLWSYRIGSSGPDAGYSLAPYANGVFLASAVQATMITVGTQTFTFTTNIDGMLITQFNASGTVINSYELNGGGDDMMDLCLDNCALYVGGDLLTPSVNFGSIVLTHTVTEAPFVARLQLAVGEPTISITGTFSMCIGGSVVLQANGASSYVWSTGAASNSIVVSPATTSVYIVTGSSSNLACAASKAQTVVVVPLPNISVASSATSICAGSSVTLSASGALTYSWNTGAQTQVLVQTPSQTSVYSVTGYSNFCSATNTVSVVVKSLPLLSASSNSSVICRTNSAVISVLGADTYTWYNGANTSSISVSPLVTTMYTVTGTSSLTACTGTASAQVFVDDCTALEEIKNKAVQFSVFPNPSEGALTIYSSDEIDLLLINVLGEKIRTLHLSANETLHVNLSDYDAGIYYLNCLQTHDVQKISIEGNH